MSQVATDPEQPAAEAQPDPAVLRAERRLRVLEELTEIGMRLARALERRVLAEDEAVAEEPAEPVTGKAKGRDPAIAFSQLSRAIRLTLALEARTDEALRALKAGVELVRIGAAERARVEAPWKQLERLRRIEELVFDAAEAELSKDHLDSFCDEYEERLQDNEALWDDPERPLREILERVCRYFGLTPDWSRWDGERWMAQDPPIWPWTAAAEAAAPRPTDPASPPVRNGAPALAAAHALE